jgi:hypothetical protein
MYGDDPPVAATVTVVVPPKHEITGAVDVTVGKGLTITDLEALEMELQAVPDALTTA